MRAVTDSERGMGAYDVCMDEKAADFLAEAADGDARSALNAVELGVLTTERSADGKIPLYDRRGIRVYPETCDPLR